MITFELCEGKTYSHLEESDLASCGCGGKAKFKTLSNQTYQVKCPKCGIQTAKRTSSQSVMREWNKAMGGMLPDETS